MLDTRAVATKAEELGHDLIKINRELKRVASVKCRLKKMPFKSTFEKEMTEVLLEEQLLKNVRDLVAGPRKNVNTITQEEVDQLNLPETMKAIKAIQSKKTHTKWLTCEPGNNDEYREACRIEDMLKKHRDELMPRKSDSKSEVLAILDSLKVCNDMSAEDCIRYIEEKLKED